MTRRSKILPLAPSLLALAACGPTAREPEPEPAPTPSPTLAEQEVSIFRPDVLPEPAQTTPDPLELTVPFAEGGVTLGPAAESVLGEMLEAPQLAQGWPIVLRGHTDSAGDDQANLRASRRRAEAVAGWLVENGVDRARIEIIALGEQRPVAPNARLDGTPDEEGRARNRRVTITLAPPDAEPAADEEGAQEPSADG